MPGKCGNLLRAPRNNSLTMSIPHILENYLGVVHVQELPEFYQVPGPFDRSNHDLDVGLPEIQYIKQIIQGEGLVYIAGYAASRFRSNPLTLAFLLASYQK
ncbi:hypothetical protein QAD02_021359 [Eretmocerus hayati]|uniref:Uncharacterized protein n=1 Tax=Eretmocerus hayati TaxID=131215 RepID=A0ACC2PPY4_9HYME|nr:hypothetical protein QAD02_021359 [Eretmocerus hayati]